MPRRSRGRGARALEDRAMTDVQTVEHADGHRAWPAAATAGQRSERPIKPHTNPYATD